MVERVADPLLAGVYGGEAARLSARATLPQMIDSESRFRSLVRGALIARKQQNREQSAPPLFTTMRDGMQRIVDAIVRQVPREMLRCSSAVEGLRPNEASWQVRSAGVREEFDQVILALPSRECAKLLATVPGNERSVELLDEIHYSSALTVALAYKAMEVALPEGFGFLVPRSEAKRMMACTFVHNKFENRVPEGTALLRVFMGGTRDPEALGLTDDQILEFVRRDLRDIVGIAAEPKFARVYRWPHAMPQYEVGHLVRVARIEMHMQRLPGLQLSGNAYHGVGIPDCVRIGRSAADAVMRKIRSQQAPVG
jgi:oxygen-dependent protoporphyrinogen oxidase